MLKGLADNSDEKSLAVQFRRKRFTFFRSLLSQLERPIHILDVGGAEEYWKMMKMEDDRIFVTLLNLTHTEVTLINATSIIGDARSLQMADHSFDVVFSNSVIEHVGTYQDQFQMASEVRRVGKRYFVQTPNRYFPLEPHFLFPFFQFLPLKIRMGLLQNFNLGWFAREPNAQKAREIVESVRLLDKYEFAAMFPDASIYEEKIFGLTKSFVAYGGWKKMKR